MFLTADYHSHTIFSDGDNTILENAKRAKEIGLKELGATEHGLSHVFFGLQRKKIPEYIEEIREAERETGVRVLVGLESNLRGESGLCDLTEKDYDNFDLYLFGVHVCIWYEKLKDYFHLGAGNYMRAWFNIKPSKSIIRDTTKAYINAVKKNPVDILTHINYMCFCDPVEVAKACADYGTYMEISAKKPHMTDEELFKVAQTGVRFVINSDAHSIARIGDYKLAEEQIDRVGVSHDLIDNIDGKLPNFRFAEFKKHRC